MPANPSYFWQDPKSDLRTHITVYNCTETKNAPAPSKVLIYVHGSGSSKTSTFAKMSKKYAGENNLGFISYDLYGHGKSDGDYNKILSSMWTQQLHAIIQAFAKDKNCILIGHSMGANLLMYNARDAEFNSKVMGMLLLAPAVDLSTKYIYPSMPQALKDEMEEKGAVYYEFIEGLQLHMSKAHLEDNLKNNNFEQIEKLELDYPVTLIHGKKDALVPWKISEDLSQKLVCPQTRLLYVDEGEHNLRDDISKAMIMEEIDGLVNFGSN